MRRLEPSALEPYFFDAPWSAQLAGKRVLVVHPFEPSIRGQLARRTAIWSEKPEILPACEVEIARSPYGFAHSGFNDWFAMLGWFEQRIAALHQRARFDVALIGCGVAGVPLAGFVKRLGAIAIQVGDPLPVLFGIRTAAAENRPELQRFFNAAWVQPQATELAPPVAPAFHSKTQHPFV